MMDDFEGNMHTSKYAKMAKCSTDTALRDIRGLVDHGILVRNPGGGRSNSYRLALSPAAGEYREDIHLFKNQQFSDILTSFTESIKLRRDVNKNLRFIFTVSPAPLTTTQPHSFRKKRGFNTTPCGEYML